MYRAIFLSVLVCCGATALADEGEDTEVPAKKINAMRAQSKAMTLAQKEEARKIFEGAFNLFRNGDFQAAQLAFERGLNLDPANGLGHYYLGEILSRLNDGHEARVQYVLAKALLPVSAPERFKAEVALDKPFHDCSYCPEMVVIPPGNFDMGSPATETGRSDDEGPVHRVSVKKFALGKTEVTQGQWKAIMGSNPSRFSNCGDDCPVEQVSWSDAQEYIRKLNAKTGKQYRLPSEAEWEYACRAGGRQQYCGSDNLDSVGWYNQNSSSSTHPAGRKQANAFGLYDMTGNVWEWVEDSYHDSYNGARANGSAWVGDGAQRVLRGGAWFSNPQLVRAAYRFGVVTPSRNNGYGIRLARTLP
jgi:formylglycine-generating enzyme required for sulfatase activity